MVPIRTLETVLKRENTSYAFIVSGKEFNVFCVGAIFSCVKPSSSSKELKGLCVERNPLKMPIL
jgi:hypothetical protein